MAKSKPASKSAEGKKKTTERDAKGRIKKGSSGNPGGRSKTQAEFNTALKKGIMSSFFKKDSKGKNYIDHLFDFALAGEGWAWDKIFKYGFGAPATGSFENDPEDVPVQTYKVIVTKEAAD